MVHETQKNTTHPKSRRAKDYRVGGCTALLDALGDAIHHIGNIHKYARPEDVPEHTIFLITTDGMENYSRRYTADRIKRLIERQKAKYNWEFVFVAANIDAATTARNYGIDEEDAVEYIHDSEGVLNCYEAMAMRVSATRTNAKSSAWRKNLDEDRQRREQR